MEFAIETLFFAIIAAISASPAFAAADALAEFFSRRLSNNHLSGFINTLL